MNVLLITTTYPTPWRPRQGTFNETLVAGLRRFHQVHVIAPVPWTQRLHRPQMLASHRGGNDSGNIEHPISFYPPKILRHRYGRFLWHSIRHRVVQLGKEFRPDVVLGYWMHPDGDAALRAARYFGVPGIVVSGGSDLRGLTASTNRRKAVTRVLNTADHVVVVSEDLRRRAIEFGVDPDQVNVIRRGVRPNLFYPVPRGAARLAIDMPQDAIVLLWAGRLEPVKNPAMMLYAAQQWQRRWGERVRVLMFGDGSMRSELESLRRQLGLHDVVRIAPAVSQTELALRYKAADLTVLTSHSEGVPNVLLESIACGVPFVATNVGGVNEIATPDVDALIADGNVQQLVETVIQQIECPGRNRRHVERSFVPSDVSEMAGRFDTVIRRVVEAKPRGVFPLPAAAIARSESTQWTEAAG